MTTIIYNKDVLVGDSRNFEIIGVNAIPYEKSKITLHNERLYAYGVCAKSLPFEREVFHQSVNEYVLAYIDDKPLESLFPFPNIYILVMGRDKTFTLYNDGTLREDEWYKQYIRHHRDAIVAYGSGAPTAILAIYTGATIIEALEDAVLSDVDTGGDLYGVKRTTLYTDIPVTPKAQADAAVNSIIEKPQPDNKNWLAKTLNRKNVFK